MNQDSASLTRSNAFAVWISTPSWIAPKKYPGKITRIALAFEAGRDGFWLARWLRARGVEAHVIHPSSVAVSREQRRAKTDQLDTELLKRGLLGCLPIFVENAHPLRNRHQ